MVALEIEGARRSLVAIQRAPGWTWNLHIVVIHLAVTQHRHVPADEGNIESRPLAQSKFRALWRRIVAVNGSHLMRGLPAAFRADLHLVAAPQIDAAVPARRAIHLDVQL